MSPDDEKQQDDQPNAAGDSLEISHISGGVVAVGRGAVATAVYQGLTVEQVSELVVQLKHKDQPKVWDGRIPYLGLTSFHESDAPFFFGRESLVNDLLKRVQEARFIVIAGPSVSGKSSVARAGLFYALHQGRINKSETWLFGSMQPEGNPLAQLAVTVGRMARSMAVQKYFLQEAAGNPLALHEQVELLLSDDPRQRCVLLVDQFEEIFTQTKDEEARSAFINLLTMAAKAQEGRTTIIISLRADFVADCARYPHLRALMSRQFQLVGAMDPPDLAKAITLPALQVGAQIEAQLVSRIMDDMKGEPGALPLMSFALHDLFEAEMSKQGQFMDLTLLKYLDRGGIESALERHANRVFDEFTPEQKDLAYHIFSRLIEVGRDRVATRRTVTLQELVPRGTELDEVTAVVRALTHADVRLLTTSATAADLEATKETTAETTVTIAHEKLIEAWPWLRQLVDDNREAIALQNQISTDAQMWQREQDNGFLYQGGRLYQAEERIKALNPDLENVSQNFIQASLDLRQKEIEEKEAQRQRELEQMAALRKQTQLSEARALAAQAETAIQRNDPKASYLQALRAVDSYDSDGSPASEADVELVKALTTFHDRAVLEGHTDVVSSASFNHDESRILTASFDNTARLWDGQGAFITALEGHTDAVTSASFNHDGSRILTASGDGTTRLWHSYASIDEMRAEALRRLRFWISEEECLEYFSPTDCTP